MDLKVMNEHKQPNKYGTDKYANLLFHVSSYQVIFPSESLEKYQNGEICILGTKQEQNNFDKIR